MDDLPTETEFKSADRFTCNKGEHSFLWKGSCFYSKCRTSMFFRCPSFNHANNATNKASGSYSKPGSVRTITSVSSFSQSTHGFQPMFEKLERRRKRPFELYSESTIGNEEDTVSRCSSFADHLSESELKKKKSQTICCSKPRALKSTCYCYECIFRFCCNC